jgi:hypothetical protein
MLTMGQNGDWEKPIMGVRLSSVLLDSERFNLTAGETYFLHMQQTASLTGATPSASVYFQEVSRIGEPSREGSASCAPGVAAALLPLPLYHALSRSHALTLSRPSPPHPPPHPPTPTPPRARPCRSPSHR